jgi:hypothetical protein
MKRLFNFITTIIVIFLSVSCRPGTEPITLSEHDVRPMSTISKEVPHPNMADDLFAGVPFVLSWDLEFEGGHVNIYLYKSNKLVYTIVRKTTNDRRFKWGLPYDLPVASDYKIKVENASNHSNYGFSTKFTVKTY